MKRKLKIKNRQKNKIFISINDGQTKNISDAIKKRHTEVDGRNNADYYRKRNITKLFCIPSGKATEKEVIFFLSNRKGI